MRTGRSSGMGYGDKSNYLVHAVRQNHSPSPERYNIPSSFLDVQKAKAFSFGLSKEHFNRVYLKENPPYD
eukprot:CAMPEP_0170556958 /NCGR_PEP_ID=MMETSP0211-20121228/19087_1 /TAXON_ID=311385 /ORGANISM="Pseudokeronopsis sp., Strain OXSARD2" /LENGTH=69 /DNA_ID=CAMNT_0010867597 /DNA_START=164 /DNA_END=373 /DNA_ORIENTATION=-